ncbi:MAG TPA: hypothetical protein VF870_16455 [Ignavibacteriaceae bacterium]|jgi:hypothetical protein
MVRNILGVVLGYVAIFIFVFITFTVLYFILGADGSFEPGTYEVSFIWIVLSFILGLVAAVLGGYICVLISKNQKTALVLAGFVLVLGIVMAIPALGDTTNEVQEMRSADVPNMEAMQKAKQPAIMLLLNPIIGALGVFAGSKLRKEETV